MTLQDFKTFHLSLGSPLYVEVEGFFLGKPFRAYLVGSFYPYFSGHPFRLFFYEPPVGLVEELDCPWSIYQGESQSFPRPVSHGWNLRNEDDCGKISGLTVRKVNLFTEPLNK